MFAVPKREILSIGEIAKWKKSKAFKQYNNFVISLNASVKEKSFSNCGNSTEKLSWLIELLSRFNSLIDSNPPFDDPQRFGNKAYRDWHQTMKDVSEIMIKEILQCSSRTEACVELLPYLHDSFGNATRIDYGTGHEASFIMFLLCAHLLGLFSDEDFPCIVSIVFRKYIQLCQRLQVVYRMEPAGSHGVWCLDDYQFLPFVFGSSQLIGMNELAPCSFVKDGVAIKWADEYMFMDAIKFINTVKTGPFSEHSNQLWNISGVVSWSKVNAGLLKMYHNEVLMKFPVVQHFVFGNLFSIEVGDDIS